MSILGRPKRKQDVKKSAIKKFADSYRVGIAYLGLAELKLSDEDKFNNGSNIIHVRRYRATISSKDTMFGEIYARILLNVAQTTFTEKGLDYFDVRPWDAPDNDTYQIWSHNLNGMIENSFSAKITYYHFDEIEQSNMNLSSYELEGYDSIEDILNAISVLSEEAWGDIAIELREYAEKLKYHNSTKDYFPDTIELSAPENTLVLGKRREGNWYGVCSYSKDGIKLEVYANINALPYDEDGELHHDGWLGSGYYSVSREHSIGGYHVEVIGRFVDENTQVSDILRNPEFDRWKREFEKQGAETLDGAKAIAEANIREVYQEFIDYVNSERNYVTQSNGRGYARTTENSNEWNYNFGDSWDDIRYENWDDERDEVWDRYWRHQSTYDNKWASAKKSKSVPQFSTVVAKLRKKE